MPEHPIQIEGPDAERLLDLVLTRDVTKLAPGKAWYALAANAFAAGKLPLAEVRVANALKVERAVLEADNPTIADTLSMQGQILQGRV